MPFQQRILRGQKVFARVDEAGNLLADDGKVEIRYKKNDGKLYRALAQNLLPGSDAQVIADADMGEAAAAVKKETPPSEASASGDAVPAKKVSARKKATLDAAPAAAEATVAKPGRAVVYADGACSGNPGPCGLGVRIECDGEVLELAEYLGTGTNNIGELTAILRAAEKLRELNVPADIHTDSQYSIGVLSKGWKAKANVELIAHVKAALKDVKVKLHYIKGHAGLFGNERADALAVAAVKMKKTGGWQKTH